MEATVVKDWESLSGFVYNRVSGKDTTKLSEKDYDLLNKEVSNVVNELSVEDISEKAKKIMSLNILDRKVNFDIFEKVPQLWYVYYSTALVISAEDQRVVKE